MLNDSIYGDDLENKKRSLKVRTLTDENMEKIGRYLYEGETTITGEELRIRKR